MEYLVEWEYSKKEGQTPPDQQSFDIHCNFHIRFPDIPPGENHVAFFGFNVLSPQRAVQQGITGPMRGYIVTELFSYSHIIKDVEKTIEEALSHGDRKQGLEDLNKVYIRYDLDFSDEFRQDVLNAQAIIEMIEEAFDGVERGAGITLHEAVVIDDYGSEEERKEAKALDKEQKWQDIPDADFRNYPSYLVFLDSEGYRYYLPATMIWALKPDKDDRWDSIFFLYRSLLPTVLPMDQGKGLGKQFDVNGFIQKHSFTPKQVKAIYHFLCFIAIEAEYGIHEDDYPAMLEWKRRASIKMEFLSG